MATDRGDYRAAGAAGVKTAVLGVAAGVGIAQGAGTVIGRGATAQGGTAVAQSVPRAYSVAYETNTPRRGLGSRASYFESANRALLEDMAASPDLARAINTLVPELEHSVITVSGQVRGISPPGWTWHHAPGKPGVMQLVPRTQHRPGSAHQPILHPNKSGGHNEWGHLY